MTLRRSVLEATIVTPRIVDRRFWDGACCLTEPKKRCFSSSCVNYWAPLHGEKYRHLALRPLVVLSCYLELTQCARIICLWCLPWGSAQLQRTINNVCSCSLRRVCLCKKLVPMLVLTDLVNTFILIDTGVFVSIECTINIHA